MTNLKKGTKNKKQKTNVKNIKSNIIRKLSDFINKMAYFKNIKGNMYFQIHNFIIFTITFITVFNNSIYHLIIILIIISLDAFSIVVLHECPLTGLERKYLGESSIEIRNKCLKDLNISYDCEHDYEKQIELLINIWCIVSFKILCIIFFSTFKIHLNNFNNIYS
jgi:hypothetical protein